MLGLIVQHGGDASKVPQHVLAKKVKAALDKQWQRLRFGKLIDKVWSMGVDLWCEREWVVGGRDAGHGATGSHHSTTKHYHTQTSTRHRPLNT